MVLSSTFGFKAFDRCFFCEPRSRGGVRVSTLPFCTSLYAERAHSWGYSHPRKDGRKGKNRWNTATCLRASWNLSTMELKPESASRASRRKTPSEALAMWTASSPESWLSVLPKQTTQRTKLLFAFITPLIRLWFRLWHGLIFEHRDRQR